MATGPYRVLVVGDEPTVCALIGDHLRQQGYDLTVATEPEQAIALLDGGALDLILTDISMPRLSGLDVLVCAKRKPPDCRVVPITAHGTRDHVAHPAGDEVLRQVRRQELRQGIGDHGSRRPLRPAMRDVTTGGPPAEDWGGIGKEKGQ